MSTIDTTIRGKRWGDLVAQYRVGRRVAVRCRCTRLVFFAAEELASGAITSCGCSPPSLLRRIQQHELGAEMRRVVNFSIASRAR
jgi:hypothetical protein